MAQVYNLLDMMKPEDKKRALERFKRRMEKGEDHSDNRISNEMYLLSEVGYYFGWQAIQDVRMNRITLEELYPILEGARKIWYVKLVEEANTTRVAAESTNVFAKKDVKNKVYKDGMKPYVERAEA